jgi:hypothetical protein
VEVDIDRWFRKYGNSIPFALPNHLQLPTRSDNHRETADVSTPPRQAPQVRKRIALNIRISHRIHSISMRRPQPLSPSQLRLCNLPLRDGFVAVFRDILTRRSVGAEPAQAAEDAWAHCQIREDEVRY